MAKIAKIKWNNINGGTDRTDVYPITSDRAVYNADNKTMRQVIRERGVVNISTYFTYDGTPEKLTLEAALKKITEENRCPGFLATILTTEDEWWTFRYNAYTVDDDSWNNTDNWSPFHAGWLKTDTISEDPETPLHLEWVVKNYIYTLKGWIDAVSTEKNGYFTAEDYKKFLQALEDIKDLQERMAAAEATIKNHEERLTSAENTIKDHESRLVNAESRITSAESRITSAENRISSTESSINSINSSISSINGSLNTINSSLNTINSSISSVTGSIEEINKLLETLQNTVNSLPTDAGVTSIKATSLSNIIIAMPTGYVTGQVDMQIGVDENALTSWLEDNGFGEGDVDVYPDVNNSASNPTDIYFTSNQLITGSVSGNVTMTFHATNGVAGAEVQMILLAGSNGATITIADNSAVVTDEYTTITVEANKYVELNAIFDGSKIYVRSSSKES